MSYYKTIDGKQYEKSLLDLADELIAGRGDGRISAEDLQQITTAVLDGDTITDIERATLKYIMKNYELTDAASAWYFHHTPVIADEKRYLTKLYQILDDDGIDYTDLRIDFRVLEGMNKDLNSKVSFIEAFKSAIHLFLTDNNRNAPLYEVDNITDHYLGISASDLKDETKWHGVVQGLLKERINEGYLSLIPIWDGLSEEEKDKIEDIPDIDVSSRDSWIFFLGIRTDDHQFWAIIDRDGEKAPYVYGYN